MNVPYSPLATARGMARELYPAAYRDFGIPTAPPPGMAPPGMGPFGNVESRVTSTETPGMGPPMAPAAPMAQGGPPKYRDFLLAEQQNLGRPLTAEELLTARDTYKHNIFVPENMRRGAKQYQIEMMLEAFDHNANLVDAEYSATAQQATPPEGSPDPYGNSTLGAYAAEAVGGVGKVATGVASLLDLGYRMSPFGLAEGEVTGRQGQTFLGKWAGDQTRRIDEAVASFRTKEQEDIDARAAQRLQELDADPNSTWLDRVEAIATSGNLLRKGTGILAGMALPGIGVGGNAARAAISQLPKTLQTFTRVAAVGAPQSGASTGAWESEARERAATLDISEFSQATQQASRDMQELGVPKDQADLMAKNTSISQALPFVASINLLTDVALAAIGPFGKAETLIARGGAAGGLLPRIAGAAGEEAVEEGIAGGAQQIAQNLAEGHITGQPIPATRGALTAAAQGNVMGAVVGGGAALRPQARPTVVPSTPTPTPTPTPTSTPTSTPTPGVVPPTVPRVPGTSFVSPGTTYAAGPGVPDTDLEAVKQKIANTLATKLAPRTSAFRKTAVGFDAQGVIQAAAAQAAALAGDKWNTMSSIQKLDAVETAVEAINKISKVKTPDLIGELTATRELINQASQPPQVVATPVPAGITPAPAAATPVPATTPTGKGKKPLRQPKAAAVAPTTDTPATPTEPEFAVLSPGDKLTATEQIVETWNAANPKNPITLGRAVGAIAYGQRNGLTTGKTVAQLGAEIGKLVQQAEAPPAATTPAKKPLRKPVPKPPSQATATPAPAAATPVAAPAAPAPAPAPAPAAAATPAPAAPETVIDAVNRILKGRNLTVGQVSAVIDGVNESRKSGTNAPLVGALKGVTLDPAQLQGLVDLTKPKKVPAPPSKKEEPAKTEPKKDPLKGKKKEVPQPPSKTNKLKKPAGETQPPKPQAPAGAGAEGSSAKPAGKTETIGEAVGRVTNNELSPTEESELVDAIKLGRESGDPGPISAAIKQLEEDGAEFTADQKRELRTLATPQATREPTVEGTPPETVALDDSPSADTETDESILELAIEITKARGTGKNRNSAAAVLRAVGKSKHSTRHQKWLALRIAPILETIGTRFAFDEEMEPHGRFFPATNLITIRTVRPSTIIHEALHAVTSHAMNGMLPNTEALAKKWDNLYKYLTGYIAEQGSSGGEAKPVPGETPDFITRVMNGLERKEELLTYALTDKNMRGFLLQIPPMEPSKANNFWQEFKALLVDFYATLFNADASQRSFLDEVIEAAAETVRATEAAGSIPLQDIPENSLSDIGAHLEAVAALSDADPPAKKAKVSLTPVGAAQRLWEVFAVAGLGMEKAEQDVRRNGGNVTPENSPYYASRKYTSDLAEMKAIDNLEVVEPVRNWLTNNWRKFGSKNAAEFRKDLDKFLQNYHMLTERNPSIWAETVKLNAGAELTRAELIDSAYAGEITGAELNQRLISLAQRHAVTPLDQWSEETKLGKSNQAMRDTLAELKKKGFDTNTLAEFNELVQHIRDRSRQRMIDSGRVDAADPFATRGWEWYVPLKGHLSVSEQAADYDIGSNRGETKSFRNSNLKVLEGRQSNADNALTQLVEDMNNSSTAAAEGEFASRLFEFAVLDPKNKEILGAKYTRYYGTPKSGYYAMKKVVNKKTGKVTYEPGTLHATLTVPKSGFIYHNGNEHYVVYLPNDSQLNRGVSGLRRVTTPYTLLQNAKILEKPLKAAGVVTNVMARAYTTWHPVWQLMVGFLRDTTSLPTTVAVTVFDSPLQATAFTGRYMTNLAKNTAELSRLPSVAMSIWGNRAKLKEYIDANPDSLFARMAAYREAGGSTEFAQGLNKDRADDLLFGRLEPTAWDNTKAVYHKWNDITSNWAALLENVGRVAAFEALVDGGMSQHEAAAITKSALDYGQSGEWGRMINLWHAFFRVGATSVDTIRRAFTKPTGEVDSVKLAKWAPFFGAMGVVAYFMQGLMMGTDDDGEERIKKMDANTLTQRIVFPGMDGKANSYPIGLGLPQLLLTPGILGAAVQNGHISAKEAVEAYYTVLLRSSPVQPTGLKKGSGPVNFGMTWALGLLAGTPIRPGIELHTNTNAFGNVVHTEWIDKAKDKADQGMPSSGQEWKDIARFMRDLGIDMYPEDYAHLSRGYGGQIATEIVRWTIDKERREMEGVDSSAIRTSLRLGVSDEDFYYRNEARDVIDELNVSRRRMNAALADGERESTWMSQNPADRRRIAEWKALDKARKKYYEEIAAIRENRLLSTEGRRLQKKRADARLREAVNRAQRVIDATAD